MAIVQMIISLHEIAHLLSIAPYLAIVCGGELGFEILRRQVVMEPARAQIGHENSRRLQGLDEAAGKAQCDAVLDPGIAHTASTNGDDARLAALRLIAVKGEELLDGFLVGDELAGEDVASADTRRQRDVEIPTGRKACRPRCRRDDAGILMWNLHDRGAVVRRIVAVGVEGLTEAFRRIEPRKPVQSMTRSMACSPWRRGVQAI